MSSPVPLLRAPVPGQGRSQSGSRTPKLSLGIPPSPNVKPAGGDGQAHPPREVPRLNIGTSNAPKLSLAIGGGGNTHEGRPQIQPLNISTVQEQNNRTRSDSFQNASVPGSATSSTWSQLSLAMGGHGQKTGTPDPSSAITDRSVYSDAGIGGTSMEREGSMGGLSIDFDKLSLEKGRPLDVEDLDDDAWAAASDQKKIVELGSLGEGAGGAVTRCKLEQGQTVFALKVSLSQTWFSTSLTSNR